MKSGLKFQSEKDRLKKKLLLSHKERLQTLFALIRLGQKLKNAQIIKAPIDNGST